MIVWLRSGNTFFRIALHHQFGVPTHTVYDVDGVTARIGIELMGARALPMPLAAMRASPEPHFVKTHRRRDDPLIAAEDRAICLVRDGRDCTVSWARLRAEGTERFAEEARAMIRRREGGTGG